MKSALNQLSSAVQEALKGLFPTHDGLAFAVMPCHDAKFGDYQSNAAMPIAKALGKPPREVAQQIISRLKANEICNEINIAGVGFINFKLKDEFVARQIVEIAKDPDAGIEKISNSRRIVIDFSSPNIAKPMHVGHIRSTFLGDALARISRAVGHQVITDNHLGDWGTQFGKLIYGLKRLDARRSTPETLRIEDLERIYKETHEQSEKDPEVLVAVRNELAKLQAGDSENVKIWREISKLSLEEFKQAYSRMGVSFDHQLGESHYNPMLPGVVEELKKLGIAETSEGAVCVFFRDDPELKDAAPMLVQKADGAFLYATTDLATILYRIKEWKADEILYVTDARQQLHFKQVFATIKKWQEKAVSFKPSALSLKHIVFGSILGADKKPIKTRSGDPIRLNDLLDEAKSRALKIIEEKNPDLSPLERENAARVIGIGALKYADLCQNRNLDYVFDWNKLLALQGNTAPYLIYAYVRIASILRSAKSSLQPSAFSLQPQFSAPEELALAKHLIQFSDILHSVLEDCRPHLLTNYLYELSVKFSRFYEACPVLKAEEPSRSVRLLLCNLTARILRKGLNLLGIDTLEKM